MILFIFYFKNPLIFQYLKKNFREIFLFLR